MLAASSSSLTAAPAQARGLITFPCPNGLGNTYHLMRSGSSLLEEDDIWETNPLFLTNEDAALSQNGKEQVNVALDWIKKTNLNPTMIRYSLATSSVDTANMIDRTLRIGRDRMVPEFNFMDPRAVGAWDGSEKHITEAAIWAMDMDEAGKDGTGARPPPNEDGTPHETLSDQAVRLSNLMSVLETQFSGESILLVFPDGTGPALLSCMIAGIPLNRVHELEYASGEVRADVNYDTTLSLLKKLEQKRALSPSSEEELDDYQLKLQDGRKQLVELRKSSSSTAPTTTTSTTTTTSDQSSSMALSKKYRQEEEEQRAIEANMQALAQQREKEAADKRMERQRLAAQVELQRQEQRQREAAEREARRQQISEERRRGSVLASGTTTTTTAAVDPVKAFIGTLGVLGIGALGSLRQRDKTNNADASNRPFQPAFSTKYGDWDSSFEEEDGPREQEGLDKISEEDLEDIAEPPVPTMSEKYKGWNIKRAMEHQEEQNKEYWEEREKEGKKRFQTADEILAILEGYKESDIPTTSIYDNYDQDDDDAWLNTIGDIMNEDDDGGPADGGD